MKWLSDRSRGASQVSVVPIVFCLLFYFRLQLDGAASWAQLSALILTLAVVSLSLSTLILVGRGVIQRAVMLHVLSLVMLVLSLLPAVWVGLERFWTVFGPVGADVFWVVFALTVVGSVWLAYWVQSRLHKRSSHRAQGAGRLAGLERGQWNLAVPVDFSERRSKATFARQTQMAIVIAGLGYVLLYIAGRAIVGLAEPLEAISYSLLTLTIVLLMGLEAGILAGILRVERALRQHIRLAYVP